MKINVLLFIVLMCPGLSAQAQTAPVPGAAFPTLPYSPMTTDPVKVQALITPYSPAWRNNKFPWYGTRPSQDPVYPDDWRGYDHNATYKIVRHAQGGVLVGPANYQTPIATRE